MKRILIAVLVLAVATLTGCILPPFIDEALRLVSNDGTIHAPKINVMPLGYDANLQPGDKVLLDFNPGHDQYGNKTGLDSSRYTITEVTVKCDLKTVFDTVFEMDENVPVWFPGYTAPLEAISGLPVPYYPLAGYPWDSCREDNIPPMGSQMATITAVARAEWIEIEFVLPERDGSYRLDLPGQSPTSENVISIRIDTPGLYTVTHSRGEVYEFEVPVDWFFIEGSWRIDIGPGGLCT